MFDRYSEKAKRVIFFARYEASQSGTPQIDTEHLLLGIVREDHDILPSVIGPDVNKEIGNRIRQQNPPKEKIPTNVDLPLSEASKRVLNYAVEEADQLKGRAITHRHILIGLLREKGCLAQQILADLGLTPEVVRNLPRHEETADDEVSGKRLTGKPHPNTAFIMAMNDAVEEASLLRSTSAGPEHLLLALLRAESSLAFKILKEAGISYDSVRRRLEE